MTPSPQIKTAIECFSLTAPAARTEEASTAIIHTDGACVGNPGPGGWAAIIEVNGTRVEISGRESDTTNNRMELLAAIRGLEYARDNLPGAAIAIFSDSQYLVNGASTWRHKWKRNSWRLGRKATAGPVKNQDLWIQIDALCEVLQVEWHWVRGHNGHALNERCDVVATREANANARRQPSVNDCRR